MQEQLPRRAVRIAGKRQIESSRNAVTDSYRGDALYDNCPAESPDLIVLDFDYVSDLQRSNATGCTGVNHIPRRHQAGQRAHENHRLLRHVEDK